MISEEYYYMASFCFSYHGLDIFRFRINYDDNNIVCIYEELYLLGYDAV
jgi:hypothetical protein